MRPLIVLPTYNERETVGPVLAAAQGHLPEADILVVDDSSPDGTAQAVREKARELGSVHLMVRPAKEGLGRAYRAGFGWGLERGYDVFVEMDADFSHDPADLPRLVAPLEDGYDVVIGSRYAPGGRVDNWRVHRRALSRAGNIYSQLLMGLGVKDSTAGFRAYTATVLQKIDLDSVYAEGYGFQIEMTYRAQLAGASILEVPINFVERVEGQSKMSRAVVAEAMWLVTKWGAQRALERARGRCR